MAQGTASGPRWSVWLHRNQSVVFPITLLASLIIFVVPLPTPVMDLLLSANITLAVLVLLATLTVHTPLEFTVFPTVLLATTLFRLVLNVATTRLILTNAITDGTGAAGHVVEAFGEFVAGGNIILGVVIFVILVVINFSVINRGTVRTSEVSARFALDAMPGKQMAVDADLNAGIIDDQEAKRRRDEITEQADFYGSIDGASRFVRGDAIAGIIITLINVIGGIAIGTLSYGMTVTEAMDVFTRLTIGDGLVSQLPAMLLSMSAGFLVTRQSKAIDLGTQLSKQVLAPNPETLFIAGGFVGALALSSPMTGLPFVQLSAIAAACVGGALLLRGRTQKEEVKDREETRQKEQAETQRPTDRVEDALRLDALELEVGYALIPLADKRKGGDLEERIVLLRRQLAHELGVILPGVRLRDNPNLPPNDYEIKLKGNPVDRGTAYPGHYLAIDTGMTTGKLQGIKTKDPLFDQNAYWVDPSQRERAEMFGYTVIEASQMVTTHLTETIKRYAADLLNRERAQNLIDVVRESAPNVVSEVIPEVLKLGDVQRVLQNLLRERVSIRDLETILEALGDYGAKTKDPDILTEYVRHRLSRSICQQLRDSDRLLKVLTLDPALEDTIAAGVDHTDRLTVKLSPQVMEGVSRALAAELPKLTNENRPQVALVGPQSRAALKHMTQAMLPNLAVLSYNEITRDTKVESVGMVSYQPAPRRQTADAATR